MGSSFPSSIPPVIKTTLFAAALLVTMIAPSRPATPSPLDFALVNKTGMTVTHVYVSPTHEDHWGDDVMEEDVLANNETVDIEFDTKETVCSWDLKVTDSDGDDVEWEELNLCKASKITLKYENKRPTAIVE